MPLAVVKTNLSRDEIPYDFMEKLANCMVRHMECDLSLAMVEVHSGLQMLRNGSREPMCNIEIHHNYHKITDETKRDYGAKFAEILFEQLRISLERVLVLFFDTAMTTAKAGQREATRF